MWQQYRVYFAQIVGLMGIGLLVLLGSLFPSKLALGATNTVFLVSLVVAAVCLGGRHRRLRAFCVAFVLIGIVSYLMEWRSEWEGEPSLVRRLAERLHQVHPADGLRNSDIAKEKQAIASVSLALILLQGFAAGCLAHRLAIPESRPEQTATLPAPVSPVRHSPALRIGMILLLLLIIVGIAAWTWDHGRQERARLHADEKAAIAEQESVGLRLEVENLKRGFKTSAASLGATRALLRKHGLRVESPNTPESRLVDRKGSPLPLELDE